MSNTSTLTDVIFKRIQREGPLPFVDFMRMALYEPDYGYYVTGTSRIGWQGDYFTSTDVSSVFAHCMGRQLYEMWNMLGQPSPFVVLEQGAGRNNLKQQVLVWAQREKRAMFDAIEYRTEDIGAGHDALHSEQQAGTVDVLISNELVDAFPVHVMEARDGHLYEVYVDVMHGRLHEVLDEPSSEEVAHYFDYYKIPWSTYESGWRAEINLDAIRWLQQSTQLLKTKANRKMPNGKAQGDSKSLPYSLDQQGTAENIKPSQYSFLLAIDYGEKAKALYTRERYRGTLACYFQHQLTEQPLVRPGEQDITAHVNFNALIDEGRRQGLRLHGYSTQKDWLESMGLTAEIERKRTTDFASMDTERATDAGQKALLAWHTFQQGVSVLTNPYGMGNFKVLVMKR